MKRTAKICTNYYPVAGGGETPDADLVAQIVAALERNVAVPMGHWLAHPSGVLVRGTADERNATAFFTPAQLLAKMGQAPQPKSAGVYQDFQELAAELVRVWRWEMVVMEQPIDVANDAACLIRDFGVELALVIARDWAHAAPAQGERTHWHRVFATIRNAQEPAPTTRKPTAKQGADAQEQAKQLVKSGAMRRG